MCVSVKLPTETELLVSIAVIREPRQAPRFFSIDYRIVLPMAACQSEFAVGQTEFRPESAVALFNRAAQHKDATKMTSI
jgi:hypothetical protein